MQTAPAGSEAAAGRRRAARAAAASLVALAAGAAGCNVVPVDPAKATRPYPKELTQKTVVQIQVIPGPTSIDLVNATAVDYNNFDLWLNHRYVTHVDAMPAGKTLTVPLGSFWDWRGEGPFEGGILRYFAPTPIALVQMQFNDTDPLVGLIAVLPEGTRDFYENQPATPDKRPRRGN